jgi:pimeloyl-ACP methyl ester carboxylesterase
MSSFSSTVNAAASMVVCDLVQPARPDLSVPIDNLRPLARAAVPIIAVYGEADVDLPPAENILLVQKRYAELGGEITVLAKKGVGHHPHSLLDPTPILEFILPRAL